MTQSKPHKRKEEIKKLMEQHNISVGLISELTNLTRYNISQSLNHNTYDLSEKKYKILFSAIEKIINNDFPPEAKGFHMEFHSTSKPNRDELLNFIRKNNIPYKTAASVIDLNHQQLISRLNKNRRSDIPQDFKDELINKLKKTYNL